MGFLETSALEGVGVEQAFHQMVEQILDKQKYIQTDKLKSSSPLKK